MTERCHCTSLRQAAAVVSELYDAALSPIGIKVTMFRLLRRIEQAEGATISDLAAQVGLDRSTLGRNLRVLERQGLIEAGKGDDRRARHIGLTGKGRASLQAALPLWQGAQDEFARKVGPGAIEILAQLANFENSRGATAGDRT